MESMSKSAIAITLLSIALVASNIWWAIAVQGNKKAVSPERLPSIASSLKLADRAVVQSFAAIQASAAPGATRASIIKAVREADRANQTTCFNDPGVVHLGAIGLKFDNSGRLIGATRGYCPP
jgi:hypothetical protein